MSWYLTVARAKGATVPQLRDFLSRFRPAGAPGAARAAVPADRERQLAAELEPVLTLLDGPHRECAQIISAARHDAGQIVAAARAEAAALAASARRDADAARREAADRELAAARAGATEISTRAEGEAARVRDLARERMPALVRRSVALVRDLPDSAGPDPAGPGPLPRAEDASGAAGDPA
jgi:vacuolar-type H+-ATPase subunit H